ncbi:SCO family protein [bacterium]|nr:SCO family protein [bacterium]
MALFLYGLWALTTTFWVWLALSPFSNSGPEWLSRTREICFGTLSNGLPDTYGWISLAAPIPMLLALLVIMGADLRSQAEQKLGRTWPALLLVLPCLCGLYATGRVLRAPSLVVPEAVRMPGDYPQISEPLPDFQLQDQRGRSVGPKELIGSVTYLTFAYAHCETVCPSLMERLRQAAGRTGCRVVVVTLDPRRDTCGSLAGLAQHWRLPPNSLLLSGEVGEVEKTLAAFSMVLERNQSTGEITHPALVYVLDAQGRIRYRFSNPAPGWLESAAASLPR